MLNAHIRNILKKGNNGFNVKFLLIETNALLLLHPVLEKLTKIVVFKVFNMISDKIKDLPRLNHS